MPNLMNDLNLVVPELFMAISAAVLLIVGAIAGDKATRAVMAAAIVVMLLAVGNMATETDLWTHTTAFNGMFVTDIFACVLKGLCLLGASLVLMASFSSLKDDHINRFEYPVLVMLSVLGMMIMLSASHFLTVYMGLELSSLALYVLAAFRRDDVTSSEAGMKYFVLGALSSGMLLFGIALIYGFSGTLQFDALADTLDTTMNPGVIIGMAFVIAGLAFKISAVPFHMWTPDVYQGAPAPVTAFFASVPKIAAFGMLIRILFVAFEPLVGDWIQIIAFLALASMLWGAFAALTQNNVKRLLAYGSIANMGYALIGIVSGLHDGIAASLVYLAIYMMMTLGTFAVLLSLRRNGRMIENIDDLAGLSRVRPVLAYTVMFMMFSMAGIPPLAGFMAKYIVFQAAIASGFYILAIIGVLTSVIAAYYYLRIIKVMFFDEAKSPIDIHLGAAQQLVILIAVLFIGFFIIAPDAGYTLMLRAADSLVLTGPTLTP